MQRADSLTATVRWIAAQTCACGARRFGEPTLAEVGGTVALRVAGCAACHQPAQLELRLPDAAEHAARTALANVPPGPARAIDVDVIRALAPFVASAFADYGPQQPAGTIDLSGAPLGAEWQVVEWLRGSLGFGQARCVRRDGTRALATFTRKQAQPLARVAEKLRLPSPGIAPMLDVRDAGGYSVLFETEPSGVPLATPMFPIGSELALTLAGRLLEIVADAASRGGVLRGIRPELVYLDRDFALRVAPRAELFAGGMQESRDIEPEYPFDAIYQGPELTQGTPPSSASDVFSCCAVLVFALTRRTPFPGPSPMHQLMAMMQGPPELPVALDGHTATLVRAGLEPDPRKRPSARELANALLAA
jgi:hypothetical protein